MERNFLDIKEMELRLDEDYNAALNMIGEGAPEYAPFNEEDDAPAEMKRSETKAKDLH
ncbi:hypothetical protein [Planococcus beigongshangi]|uniref:hypothetical protein n=1 Tax=Planococcus beigongshangi TaxID=2782536 RepID=UPI00193BA0DC|nr:hypothetical protein [Planococcus beigongshangi]